eukprot:CAMPEP_0178920132 /NCGR_PEP_ID=MMETSP0786-20121207/14834_1 /TAXON_ID=186022 /ORGANISM="Thalassionema frauenfeldii, Strain CCMP 1798" /LENGTH=497 /DNA_ID=CAMNT_0020594163 /DNA_START=224 /DNA_END=1717 /DNA_ORIENTATION=-
MDDQLKSAEAMVNLVDTLCDLAALAGPEAKAVVSMIKVGTKIYSMIISKKKEEGKSRETPLQQAVSQISEKIESEFVKHTNYDTCVKIAENQEQLMGILDDYGSKIDRLLDENSGEKAESWNTTDQITNATTRFSGLVGAVKEFLKKEGNAKTDVDGRLYGLTVHKYTVFAFYHNFYLNQLALIGNLTDNEELVDSVKRQRKRLIDNHAGLLEKVRFYERPKKGSHCMKAGFYNLGNERLKFIRDVLDPEKKPYEGHVVNIQCYGDKALVCNYPKADKDRGPVICKKITEFSRANTKFVIFDGKFKDYEKSEVVALEHHEIDIFSVGGCGYLFSSSLEDDMPFDDRALWYNFLNFSKRAKNVIFGNGSHVRYGDVNKLQGLMVYGPGETVSDSRWCISRDKNSDTLHQITNVKHQLDIMAVSPGMVVWGDDANNAFTCNDYNYALDYLVEAETNMGEKDSKFWNVMSHKPEVAFAMKLFGTKDKRSAEIIWSFQNVN